MTKLEFAGKYMSKNPIDNHLFSIYSVKFRENGFATVCKFWVEIFFY